MIRLADHPGRRITNTQVQDLAPLHHMVQALHDLWDARGEVPPMQIQHIYVVRLQLLERGFERDVQGLGRVAGIVDLLAGNVFAGGVGEAGREFGGEDNLIANVPGLHPLANPGFGFSILVVVGPVRIVLDT